jgi:hypothetical protein
VRVGSRSGIRNRQPPPDEQQDRRATNVPVTGSREPYGRRPR